MQDIDLRTDPPSGPAARDQPGLLKMLATERQRHQCGRQLLTSGLTRKKPSNSIRMPVQQHQSLDRMVEAPVVEEAVRHERCADRDDLAMWSVPYSSVCHLKDHPQPYWHGSFKGRTAAVEFISLHSHPFCAIARRTGPPVIDDRQRQQLLRVVWAPISAGWLSPSAHSSRLSSA
jgi:hypothetical protein